MIFQMSWYVLAPALDLHRRQEQAFLKDFGGIPGESARRLGARFGHVRHIRHEAEEPVVVENRLQHHVLGYMSRSAIRVVVKQDITRLEVRRARARRASS